MKISNKYTGLTLTDKYLTVHFTTTIGDTTVRASLVKIKVSELNAPILLDALDKQARRLLLEHWGNGQDQLPWSD